MILGEYVEKHSPERRAGKRAEKQESRRLERTKKLVKKTDAKPLSSLSVRTRHIPQRIQDLVWTRDGHRCSFVTADGTRCPATTNLELDHIKPYGIGGNHEAENLRVLCHAHNTYRAEYTYGKELMQRYRSESSVGS